MKVVLRNNFHNQYVTLNAKVVSGRICLTPGQIRTARAALCGVEGCTCGGPAGERGPQEGGLSIEESPDGGAEVLLSGDHR